MKNIIVHSKKEEDLLRFLNMNNFIVQELDETILRVQRSEELPIFVKLGEQTIYFEMDLGSVKELASENFYFKLLELNTEIIPVSFGINNTNQGDPHLVLVESRESSDLDAHELLSVFDALELAADRAEKLFQSILDRA
jgi:uncharacterized protein YjfI (DUF2170 family)